MRNLKTMFQNNKKISGTMLRIERNPAIAHLAARAGLDFFMYDCEHSNYSLDNIHDINIAANALGVSAFARVPDLSKDYISRFLDAGCTGIMVPMIETVEQAQTLVKYSKYTPIGNRGYTTTGAHTQYALVGKHVDIMEEANDRVFTIAQIETVLGVVNADEIAAVNGIDALLIGPNDLSVSLGIPGDLMNPIELDAISKVAAACKKNGKAFGLHAGKIMQEKFAKDLDIVMTGTDIDMIYKAFIAVVQNRDEITELALNQGGEVDA